MHYTQRGIRSCADFLVENDCAPGRLTKKIVTKESGSDPKNKNQEESGSDPKALRFAGRVERQGNQASSSSSRGRGSAATLSSWARLDSPMPCRSPTTPSNPSVIRVSCI